MICEKGEEAAKNNMSMERIRGTRRPTMAASKNQKRIMREQSKKQRRYRRGDQDEDSTEESLGFSDHQAPPPLKAAREVIGVAVPRKARSAAGKRSHENFSSGSYGGVGEEEQSLQQLSFKAASLSFSNVSSRKTMKQNGPKILFPKSSKSSGPVEEEEDIEIEIAEVLYGLMKQTQNSKTSKFETEDRNDSEEKKAEDGSASMAVQSSSAGEGVEVEESDEPEKIEACSEGASGSMDPHEEKAENPYVEEKSIIATKGEFSCEDSKGTKAISTGLEHKRKRKEGRFEFDLMAPPPMDWDDDFTDSVSDPKPLTQDVDMKIEVLVKNEEKVEIFLEEVVVEKQEEKKLNENPNQDSSSKSTTRLQPSDSLLPQQPRKRCATHRHIAHNIHLHQKFAQTNNFWPAATGSVPQCGTKPDIPLLGSFSGPNPQHSQKKKQAAPKFLSDSGKDRRSEAGNVVETSHKLQLSVQQTPQPACAGYQMLQHGHISALPRVEHQAAVAPTSSKSVVLEFAQSTNNAALSSHLAARPLESSSVNFNGYQYPISAHIQTTPVFGGGNPAQALPLINAPFISNQMFHPSYVQQHQVQPSHQNANSSPSHRQQESHKPREIQFSSNNCFTSQKQHVSPGEMNMENAASPAASHAQNSVYGQNFSVPFQPVNFTLMPYVTMGGGGGGNGNHVEQSQKQGLKGGVELIPSKAYGMSFSSVTGNNGSGSCLNFSSMAQNPAIFQSLPDTAQQGYKITPAPQAGQQKNHHHHQISQRKTDGGSNNADDRLRAASGKSSSGTVQRQTLVFDNSSRTLNFMSSSSQQQNLFQFQLQNPHLLQKQQPAIAAKVPKSAPVSSKALMQCNSHHQSSQLKNSTAMTSPLQQRRGSQGRTQISFGGNLKSASAPQGQQRLTNHHSSSISASQSQQTDNSSLSGNGPISSPACGRNLPSILSTCPSHISELKF